MKIYQIHEIGGQYEDSFDEIVGTYIHENNAKDRLKVLVKELKAREKQSNLCQMCDPTTMENKPCFKEYVEDNEVYCDNEDDWNPDLDTTGYVIKEEETDD